MDEEEPSFSEMKNPIIDEKNTTVSNTQKDGKLDGLLKDIKSFKEFRDSGVLYGGSNNCQQHASLLSDNGIETSSGFVVDLLKERTVFLEMS